MHKKPQLIALVGGSGSGKTWLARRLQRSLGKTVSRLSLEDFYHDFSTLPRALREHANLDHPRTVDWETLEVTLRRCKAGQAVQVPKYSVATRARLPERRSFTPSRIIVMDGNWLLLRREIRDQFDFRVYLDCPAQLRLDRRITCDLSGRSEEEVRRHFWQELLPLHNRYIATQTHWADIVMKQPPTEEEVENLAETLRALAELDEPVADAQWDWPQPVHLNPA